MPENVESTQGQAYVEDSGFRLLFEAVAEGMLLAAADGAILDVNPEACALLEREREEVVEAGRDVIFEARRADSRVSFGSYAAMGRLSRQRCHSRRTEVSSGTRRR